MYGDSLKHYNVAVVTPNKEPFIKFVKSISEELALKPFEELCNDIHIATLLKDKLNEEAKRVYRSLRSHAK